jgi:hypothetical protein
MSQTVGTESTAPTIPYEPIGDAGTYRSLTRQLLWLAAPVLVEHVLHIVVGLTDTYMANHLKADPTDATAATAAVGTISYFLSPWSSPPSAPAPPHLSPGPKAPNTAPSPTASAGKPSPARSSSAS